LAIVEHALANVVSSSSLIDATWKFAALDGGGDVADEEATWYAVDGLKVDGPSCVRTVAASTRWNNPDMVNIY
jgi:hypothetical protein